MPSILPLSEEKKRENEQMPETRHTRRLEFDRPATYRIRVQGHLDADSADWIAGMRVATRPPADAPPETMLTGRIRDQAQLSGLLNGLSRRGLQLLSVELIDDDREDVPPDRNTA